MAEFEANLAVVHEAIAATRPARECLTHRDRRVTWEELTDRTRRLASFLLANGLKEPERLPEAGWESTQDHLAIFLTNCVEYLESMVAAFKARVVPFNVNHRYVERELAAVFKEARPRAIVVHTRFAAVAASLADSLGARPLVLQVDDGSGGPLADGAVWYEEAIRRGAPGPLGVGYTPDDRYMIYTGGTTGVPKGVLWRQADIFAGAMGGRRADFREFESLEHLVAAAADGREVYLPAPPFMHAGGQWLAFYAFHGGHRIVLPDVTEQFDADSILDTVERERVTMMPIVGNAMGRPIVEALERRPRDLSSLRMIHTGGGILTPDLKDRLLEFLPAGLTLVDVYGSSETGGHMENRWSAGSATHGLFSPAAGTLLVSDDRSRALPRSSREEGWLARSGRIPAGYLGDRHRTEDTFRVVGGVRVGIPGDRARWEEGGLIRLIGRASTTINTGGEKVFAEEVEQVLVSLPEVVDAVVVGVPDDRWGQRVVAVVQAAAGTVPDAADLRRRCAGQLARYKVPKELVFVPRVLRGPQGKADYRWARETARDAPEDPAVQRSGGEAGGEGGPLLRVSGLSLAFGGVRALDEVSLTVERGTVCGLIGPNGAGKTTLFNCVSGMHRPQSGEMLFDGENLAHRRARDTAGIGIARTFQNVVLFEHLSVVQNVMVGGHARSRSGYLAAGLGLPSSRREERALRAEAGALLAELGLGHLAEAEVGTLPYGSRKRVEIARALMARPKLMMLDEPAAGLPQGEVAELASEITRIRDAFGVTVLLVEHHMGLVMSTCEKVVVLESGRVIAEGTADEVRRDRAVVSAYLGT